MRLKRWTSLFILLSFIISIGSVNCANAAEIHTSIIENHDKIINNSENRTENLSNKITTTTSSSVELVESSVKTATETYKNPMYDDLDSELPSKSIHKTFSNLPTLSGTDTKIFSTNKEASDYLREEMVKRTNTITFTVNAQYYNNMSQDIFNQAVAESNATNSSEGDYLYSHFKAYNTSISYTSNCIEFTYEMSYLSTYEQEQQVNAEVKNVLDSLDVYNSDEYTKIKAVHDYIVKNIKYDNTLQKHSAYNAIIEKSVVCQGFASLTYKMLKELGLGVRYITGMGNGGRHGWNIACVDGKWYNVDNTWDENMYAYSNNISYRYFLKNNSDFDDHIRNTEYDNQSFNESYPIALNSYVYSPISVSSISLNTNKLDLIVGEKQNLITTILPNNASNKEVTWTSDNEQVATVDGNGKITALGSGNAIITCKAKDGSEKYATCAVKVTSPVKVMSIALNVNSLDLIIGETRNLTTTVLPSNAANKDVEWKSNNIKVVTVDESGKITAVGLGNTVVTCTASDGSGKFATCMVTVTDGTVKVKSVGLNVNNLNWTVGRSGKFTSTVLPSNASNKGLVWKSSNTKVAQIDSNGNIKAVGIGNAVVTCTASDGSGKFATCIVTVTNGTVKVKSVGLNVNNLNWTVGRSGKFTATVLPNNATNKDVTWKSSNTKVAQIDSNGNIKAVGAGSAIITCAAKDGSGKSATCVVKVTGVTVKVKSIILNTNKLNWTVGRTGRFIVKILPSNASNKDVIWKSSNTKVAQIDSNGNIKAVGVGSAIITCIAKDGSGKSATCVVKVAKK